MTERRKMIFFDVDGTIIDANHRIPASAISAIHAAQANGHLCVVNTGRPFTHIEPAVTAIGFDGYICSCGQTIVLHGTYLMHEQLSPARSTELVALVRECNLDVVYEAESGIYYDLTRPFQNESLRDSYRRYEELGFPVTASIDAPDFQFDKFCVWPRPGCDLARFTRSIPDFQIIYREGNLLELVRTGCSKATGIQRLQAELNVAPENCYAIGDSTNDLLMLQSVPNSIAMGNAPEEVQQVVRYVTAPLHQDGLAKALEHFHLC